MNILAWLLLCLIWGTTWIFIKIGLADLPPFGFAACRFVLAALVIAPIIKIFKIPFIKTGKQWRLIILTGILQFAINYSTVFWSEVYVSSGLAAVLQATIPVFGLVLAWIFLPDEKISLLKVLGVLTGIAGVTLIFLEQLAIDNRMALTASAAIVVGAYAAAQASILIKAKAADIHPLSLLLGQIICALPFLIGWSLVSEGSPLDYHWTKSAIVCLIYLSIFGTIAAFWLYYWLLGRIESTKAMMISLVTPLVAVVVGSLVLDEQFPARTLFGGMLILSSVALIIIKRKVKNEDLIRENTEN